MRFDVSPIEYHQALDEALDFIGRSGGSAEGNAMRELLANVWDPVMAANACEVLGLMTLRNRDVALTLLVARAYLGRPIDHPRRNEIEQLCTDIGRPAHA